MPSNKLTGLYAILDLPSLAALSPFEVARDYLEGGIRIIQLRDKKRLESDASRKNFLEVAWGLKKLREKADFIFIINDDVEVAREVGSDGIHIGRDDPGIADCRKLLGEGKLVGFSSHSLEEALDAERQGADYVALGAIFPTQNKGPGHPIQGLEKLREVVQAVTIPVVAIGGIGETNIREVSRTGVAMAAMISGLSKSPDRVKTAQALCDIYNERVLERASTTPIGLSPLGWTERVMSPREYR